VTELSFNMFGFCAALFGCLATSTKTILAESLLHGYKFDRSVPLPGVSLWMNFLLWYTIQFLELSFPWSLLSHENCT
jgi:hypothetical protein